jgi:adenylate cyclase
LVLPVLAPLLLLAVIAIYKIIFGYGFQVLEKNKMRRVFAKYVDPSLVDPLIQSGEADANAIGKKRHIAVLFVDMRGFTTLSEKLRDTPEQLVQTLNEYLELTSGAVFANRGSVDKFIGDATMALFNGFVPLDDYVYKAVKAAWDMVQSAPQSDEVGFGVGVHCGDAIVGNLGPSFRKDYTAIGDTVNTAARLESNAGKGQIIISEATYQQVKDHIVVTDMGVINVKNKQTGIQIYCVDFVG